MSNDDVEAILATALRDLVSYVDPREETSTADDDVRALEDVAAVLPRVDPDNLDRLTTFLGPHLSFEMALGSLTKARSWRQVVTGSAAGGA